MNVSTPVERIDALLDSAAGPSSVDPQLLGEIEHTAAAVGEYPGVIDETLKDFRRALGLLKMKHASGDADAIELGSAHLRETWETLAPALRRLAARTHQ
jgi:hypothetical protein